MHPQTLGDALNRKRATWPALREKVSAYLSLPADELFLGAVAALIRSAVADPVEVRSSGAT